MQENIKVKYGTRGSKLALHQARHVMTFARATKNNIDFEEVIIKTLGDQITDIPLFKIGGQGLFIKEIELALLEKRIDIAIHSLKDVPHSMPSELTLLAVGGLEDARDCMVSDKYSNFFDLPEGAVIGTSSLRRQTQLKKLRKDLNFIALRGNLDTRLKKLSDGEADAIILAAAGLKRFGWHGKIKQYFAIEELTPPAGQGLLAVQCRREDKELLLPLFCNFTEQSAVIRAEAERSFLKVLQGGCSTPMGVYAEIIENQIILHSFVASVDGSVILRRKDVGKCNEAEQIGYIAAQSMLAAGAAELCRAQA